MNNDIKKEVINGIRYHLYKTNRFKKTRVEITFRRNIEKDRLSTYAFLLDMFSETSKKYPTKRLLKIKSEELYNSIFSSRLNKRGDVYKLNLAIEFINKEYINENTYLKDVLDFFYEIICNPYLDNETAFEVVKNNLILSIEEIKEFQGDLAYENTLKLVDENSVSSLCAIGTKEEVESITYDSLKKAYKDLFEDSCVDVFIMGNTDINLVKETFASKFASKFISKDKQFDLYVINKEKDKPLYKEEPSSFKQTSLSVAYNLVDLTQREKKIVFQIFNYIFGSGGLTSKLYKHVREENSLCYGIGSSHLKYDNLLYIDSNLSKENIQKAISLIDKSLEEMISGNFTEDDIKEARDNILMGLKLSLKDPYAIFNQYQNVLFYDTLTLEEFIEEFMTVTKKEIMDVSKKIKKNTVYVLLGEENGKN